MATDWDDELPGCFGTVDLKFARHPSDEERAFAWLGSLRGRGIGWSKTEAQLEAFLKNKGARGNHIEEEIAYAHRKLSPWLID